MMLPGRHSFKLSSHSSFCHSLLIHYSPTKPMRALLSLWDGSNFCRREDESAAVIGAELFQASSASRISTASFKLSSHSSFCPSLLIHYSPTKPMCALLSLWDGSNFCLPEGKSAAVIGAERFQASSASRISTALSWHGN